ncbi:MAG: SulP family inorganic anion transporter, partial [Anaerolineales bacterium]|nr:SulP family inorganic anion transporter [Anaerolineales bacterium]
LVTDFQQLGQTNLYTLAVSVSVLVIIVGARRINKKIPGALIAVVGAILVSYLVDLSSYGVAVLGTVPGGLPKLGLPTGATLNSSVIYQLLAVAFSMFIVILAQSAATSRAYANRYSEKFSENVDLVGLGLANVGAGLSGTFVVNGSPTKTQMVDSAGGRSQLATLTTSVIVLVVLLFLTKPLAFMPEAVLSSVVFLIGVELVDVLGMRRIYAQRRDEFWVALITAAVVVFVGVEQGILLAMVLSLLIHIRRGYRPKNAVLAVDSSGKQHIEPVSSHAQALPGLMVYRFHHNMYYANAEHFSEEVLELLDTADPPLTWFCLDGAAVDAIDFSAAATLREIHATMKEKGVRLVLSQVDQDVRHELDLSGVTDLVGEDAFFESISDVEDAFRSAAGNQ